MQLPLYKVRNYWTRTYGHGPRRPSKISFDHAEPDVKFANHRRVAHAGATDPRCNACKELQTKVEQKAKGVSNGI